MTPGSSSDGLRLQRIYLVPDPLATDKNRTSTEGSLYAPVPLAQVPSQMAEQLWASAEEVWVSRSQVSHRNLPLYRNDQEATDSLSSQSPSLGPIHLTDEKYDRC